MRGGVTFAEEAEPCSRGRRVDEQVQLVEQTGVEELPHDRNATR